MRTLTRPRVELRDSRSPPAVLLDLTDDYLIALVTTARARAIVTGDKDRFDHQGRHPPAMTARGVRAGWPPLNRVAAFITDCQKTVATRRQRFP